MATKDSTTPRQISDLEFESRILSCRSISPDTECWNWTKSTDSYGYGQVSLNKKTYKVHRVAAHYYFSMPLTSPLCCLHKCDNRRCFNPHHLFLGTISDNVKDMIKKGRNCNGESHHKTSLTESDVIAIRNEYAKGGVFHKDLARKYGVTRPTITEIINRRAWARVS